MRPSAGVGLLNVAVRAKFGLTVGSEHVDVTRGSHLRVRAPADFRYTIDGEELKGNQLEVTTRRAALPFVAGPEYDRPAMASVG